MIGQRRLFLLWVWALLMASLCPHVQMRKGGLNWGGRSRGFTGRMAAGNPIMHGRGYEGGYSAGALPMQKSGSSSSGLKIAGAAAAGALGGAMLGHGLSSMGQPRYAYSDFGYSGYDRYGSNAAYPSEQKPEDPAYDLEFFNTTDIEFQTGHSSAGPMPNSFTILGTVVFIILGE